MSKYFYDFNKTLTFVKVHNIFLITTKLFDHFNKTLTFRKNDPNLLRLMITLLRLRKTQQAEINLPTAFKN